MVALVTESTQRVPHPQHHGPQPQQEEVGGHGHQDRSQAGEPQGQQCRPAHGNALGHEPGGKQGRHGSHEEEGLDLTPLLKVQLEGFGKVGEEDRQQVDGHPLLEGHHEEENQQSPPPGVRCGSGHHGCVSVFGCRRCRQPARKKGRERAGSRSRGPVVVLPSDLNPHFLPGGAIMAPDFRLQRVLATEERSGHYVRGSMCALKAKRQARARPAPCVTASRQNSTNKLVKTNGASRMYPATR